MHTQLNLIHYLTAHAWKLLKETHIFLKNQNAQDKDIQVIFSWTQSQLTQLEIYDSMTTQFPRLKRYYSYLIHLPPFLLYKEQIWFEIQHELFFVVLL